MPFSSLVLDGELVVLDERARPSFGRLQKRALLQRRLDIERASVELPTTLFVFDLLGFEDFDLRGLPLETRKDLLQRILPRLGPVRYADHIERQGDALLEQVAGLGLEGIVGKKADSTYRGGRSEDWIKVRLDRTGDFVVVGYSRPEGGAHGIRRPAPGVLPRRRPGLHGPRRHGVHGEAAARGRQAPRGRRAQDAGLHGPGAHGQGPRLGRARDRLRGPLQGAHGRGPAPAPGLPPLPRGQAAGRVRVRGRRHGRDRGRAGGRGGRGAGEDRSPLQPRQGLLARGGLHQGRPDRVLPRHLAVAAPLPQGPPDRHDALSRRHPREVVLPERRARRSRRRGCGWSGSGASTPSARSTTSSATTSSRCSTSPTSARSRCTSGRAASPPPSGRTGASWISTPRARPFRTSCRSRARSTRSARRSACPTTSRRAARPGSTSCCRSAASARTPSRGRSARSWPRRSRRSCPTSRRRRAPSPRAAARCTSTTCRTATARRSPARSPRGRSWRRPARRRSRGARSARSSIRRTTR